MASCQAVNIMSTEYIQYILGTFIENLAHANIFYMYYFIYFLNEQ